MDSLILPLHTETACRRGGALALRPENPDPDQCMMSLREGCDGAWQPVSPTLMRGLLRLVGRLAVLTGYAAAALAVGARGRRHTRRVITPSVQTYRQCVPVLGEEGRTDH